MANNVVRWDYVPRPWQLEAHEMPGRFRVLVVHRRAGKTVLAVMDLLGQALVDESGRPDRPALYAYVAPERGQAKRTVWDQLKARALAIPGATANEQELRIDLPGCRRIIVVGSDNSDALRGIGLRGAVLDEVADMRPDVWPLVIRPALADQQGWALFIGTPRGRDAFHNLYELAGTTPGWRRLLLRASETGVIPEHELADLRRIMTPEQYAQEFECSFAAAVVGAYYAREIEEARASGRVCPVPHDPTLPVHTAWDLGWSDATSVVFAQLAGRELRVVDYQEWTETGLDVICQDILKRGWTWGETLLPHDAAVHELTSGTSRRSTIESLLRQSCRILPATSVDDGISAVRMLLPRMLFDEVRCKQLLWRLERYTVEARRRGEAHEQSHAADAVRYLAQGLSHLAPASTGVALSYVPRLRVA